MKFSKTAAKPATILVAFLWFRTKVPSVEAKHNDVAIFAKK